MPATLILLGTLTAEHVMDAGSMRAVLAAALTFGFKWLESIVRRRSLKGQGRRWIRCCAPVSAACVEKSPLPGLRRNPSSVPAQYSYRPRVEGRRPDRSMG